MSRVSCMNYGKLAESVDDYTVASGRYKTQERAQRLMPLDVVSKLELNPDDSLLEIGSGLGNLSIPLSFLVREVGVVDHPLCLKKFKERFPKASNITFIEGDFFEVHVPIKYKKILCYGVLPCLGNSEEVFAFIDKALDCLALGGRALFGDIPNRSLKKRFTGSALGREFSTAWSEMVANEQESWTEARWALDNDEYVHFNDDLLLAIIGKYRERGYGAYILPQPGDLPFGHSREDILITMVE
jgi:cyclopropane fatty-acyl-phospholipid synthase-like methyltransferase